MAGYGVNREENRAIQSGRGNCSEAGRVCPPWSQAGEMKNAVTWKRRAALLYTVGSWTVVGFLGIQYCRLKGKEKAEEGQAAQEVPGGMTKTISEDRLTETITYRIPGKSFYVTSTVCYKPNFVPYSTRIYNYVQSFFEDTAGKEK